MNLLEFEGLVVQVGDGCVRLKRDSESECGWLLMIPTHVEEERGAGRHLYARVRVTVALIDAAAPAEVSER
jgi:hypothetical protein